MGGYGSRRRLDKRYTVEDCWALDVNWMTRAGIFDSTSCTSGTTWWTDPLTGEEISRIGFAVNVPERWLRLHYVLTERNESFDYRVGLTTTELPWGGVRRWFICPLECDGQCCGRRVGVLYLPPHGRYYGCRHCYNLTYKSCRESGKYDAMWHDFGALEGLSPKVFKEQWEAEERWERRAERMAERNAQRKRRRKDRNWA